MAKQFIKTPDGWKVIDNPDAPWDVSRMIGQPVRGNPPSVPAPQPQAPVLPPKQAGILQVGQGPQAPQTPLGAAMSSVDVSVPPVNELDITAGQAPQVSPGILNVPQAPAAAPTPSRGILESIPGRKDANSIYDGLLQGGAAMLGGRNFREGLSHGLSAFGTEYDRSQKDALAEQKLNQPKVVPLADGAFSLVVTADGRQQVVPNKDVQKFLETKAEKAAEAGVNRAIISGLVQNQNQIDRDKNKNDMEKADSFDPVVNQYQRGQAQELATWLKGRGNEALGLPILGLARDETFGRVAGTKDYGLRTTLESLRNSTSLKDAQFLKGATSDKDILYLDKTKPPKDAPTQKWLEWIEQQLIPTLDRAAVEGTAAKARVESRGVGVPAPAQAPVAPNQTPTTDKPTLNVPGLSPKAAKYFS
jgi:hypothetical protein